MCSLYSDTLDRLFLDNPENKVLLSLEEMSLKESVLHTVSIMNEREYDTAHFEKLFMKALQQVYKDTDFDIFKRRVYSLCIHFLDDITDKEPFFTLHYADAADDERQCRQLYEEAMHYFD